MQRSTHGISLKHRHAQSFLPWRFKRLGNIGAGQEPRSKFRFNLA